MAKKQQGILPPFGQVLACPCGQPLQFGKTPDGEWFFGHFEKTCSPIVHGKNAEKVLGKLVEAIQKGLFSVEHYKTKNR